jgi:hypothetical protein
LRSYRALLCASLFALAPAAASAAQPEPTLRVASAARPASPTVGDPVRVTVRVLHPRGAAIVLGAPASTDAMEPLAADWERMERSDTSLVATLDVVLWTTGAQPALRVPVRLTLPDGEVRLLDAAAELPPVRSVLPADTSRHVPREAKDILVPVAAERGLRAAWALLAALCIAAALLVGWFLRRAARPRAAAIAPDRTDADPAALLRRARGGPLEAGDWRALYSLVATAVRTEAAIRSPGWSRDLTTSELARHAPGDAPWIRTLRTADAVRFGLQAVDRSAAEADLAAAEDWVAGEAVERGAA